jgi:hypothetical protein
VIEFPDAVSCNQHTARGDRRLGPATVIALEQFDTLTKVVCE